MKAALPQASDTDLVLPVILPQLPGRATPYVSQLVASYARHAPLYAQPEPRAVQLGPLTGEHNAWFHRFKSHTTVF